MNNRFLNYILALLVLTCLSYRVQAQNIQAEAKLQQYTIRIGDQTKLFLSVHQPAKEHVNFPKLTDTIISKIQVVSINKPDTTYDQNDHRSLTVTQSYTITSFDAGTYTIPSFSIGTAGGVLKTNTLTLQVETVKVDTTKAIYDIKQPISVSYTFLDWLKDNWYWVVLPLLAIALIIGLIWYLRKRPKAEPVVQVSKPAIPPHVIALNQLKELKGKKLWQQEEVKQYHIELSDIIREYLEKRYAIKTHEKTTDEIFAGLKRIVITDENKGKLKQILVLADLVKFAKEKPLPAENEESLEIAIDFVVATKQPEKPAMEGGSANV
ncbi:BatD family protein [Mucilaginibacter sp.]|uniref:BatD family protein n=1 Tax=Mucilaginibacter sp. TaxID=1882438 RepID=UPI00284F935F|nr:BatD family protein [Mucilaginibacter sp.]MDR3695980.1 BatD family protein [Mucilaginibacter sp.]